MYASYTRTYSLLYPDGIVIWIYLPGADGFCDSKPCRKAREAINREHGKRIDHAANVLETSGWATIVEYVRDGFGVAIVAESAITSSKGLIPRQLDSSMFPPEVTRLICRQLDSAGNHLDLSEEAAAFRSTPRNVVADRFPRREST